MYFKIAGFAGLLTCVIELAVPPPPADACGVKLTVKPTAPRKSVPRSSNPSQVLLVGSPPRRLQNDLAVAGHKVEVASDPAAAKQGSYAVVITDKTHEKAARDRFGDAVIVRSGDVGNDRLAVENRVTRKPVAVAAARPPVDAKPPREVIAAGPPRSEPKEVVTAKAPEPAPEPAPTPAPPPPPAAPEPTPAPAPKRVAAATTDKGETPRAVSSASLREEIFFATNSSKVSATRALTRAVRWLTANANVNVVVEGHADPSGTTEGNLRLSEARAGAVRDFLVENGIDSSRIEVKGFGDTQLKYGPRDGRNRRAAISATR